MSQLKYWVWLSMRFGVRPKVKLALVEHFGTPRDVYFATEADYRVRASLRPEELRLLLDKDLHEAERALAICDREHIRALTIQDAAYPQRLLQIYDPPLVLYVRGTLPPLDDRAAVAVVGTRSATPYGMRTAHKLGSEIVRHGGIVLSGLTAGIDRSAAEGALDAGGVCVGVSGTAINLDFAGACTQSVARCGAVVSEFAPNMSVSRFGFRLRNRITSGLAVATVVVEAPEKSGALLFAEDAITQGREVFAVPGNADSHASVGSNALLKDGARPATCAWDVLGDFRRMFPGTLHERIAPEPEPAAPQAPPETGDGFAQVRRPVAEKRIDKPQPEAYIDLEAQLRSLTTEQLQIVAAIDAPALSGRTQHARACDRLRQLGAVHPAGISASERRALHPHRRRSEIQGHLVERRDLRRRVRQLRRHGLARRAADDGQGRLHRSAERRVPQRDRGARRTAAAAAANARNAARGASGHHALRAARRRAAQRGLCRAAGTVAGLT